jgi:alpha-galactosidase
MAPGAGLTAALAGLAGLAAAKDDGLALTPPRGWRSWNALGLHVDQPSLEAVMDAVTVRRPLWNGSLASLADLGYTNVGLDDGWQACHAGVGGGFHRADGTPIVNTTRFPDLAAMVDHAHALNLTAGFYGNNCYCADPSDLLANFEGDVATLVAAGFDGYKLDSCGGQKDIALYSSLITASGKKVVIENTHNGPWNPEPPYKPGGDVWCPFHMYRACRCAGRVAGDAQIALLTRSVHLPPASTHLYPPPPLPYRRRLHRHHRQLRRHLWAEPASAGAAGGGQPVVPGVLGVL